MKKNDSFKKGDYQRALSETFLRIDELLKTPAGKKKLAEYSNPEN